jgi:hypothetical protein
LSSNLSSRASGLGAALLLLTLTATPAAAQQTEVRMLVQSSPLAGFRYHDAARVWDELQTGDALTLVREPNNAYDANAVRVEWRTHKLGYIPRNENRAVAFHMDRGGAVEARISKLQPHRNPRQRIEFEVLVRL